MADRNVTPARTFQVKWDKPSERYLILNEDGKLLGLERTEHSAVASAMKEANLASKHGSKLTSWWNAMENGNSNTPLNRLPPILYSANLANNIQGRITGPGSKNQADHLYRCPACGQTVDRRQLGQVLHHDIPDHKPLPTN